eukprot:SAG31_NODE_1976_length_6750_cov_8.060893_4_plen_175_part_00
MISTRLHAAALDAIGAVEERQEERHRRSYAEARTAWIEDILPKWQTGKLENLAASKRVRRLLSQGIPTEVRGAVWIQVVGNHLGLNRQLLDSLLIIDDVSASHEPAVMDSVEKARNSDGGPSTFDAGLTTDVTAGKELREQQKKEIQTDLGRTLAGMGGGDLALTRHPPLAFLS